MQYSEIQYIHNEVVVKTEEDIFDYHIYNDPVLLYYSSYFSNDKKLKKLIKLLKIEFITS